MDRSHTTNMVHKETIMKYAIYLRKSEEDITPYLYGTTTSGHEDAEAMAQKACNDNPEFKSWQVTCIDDLAVEDMFNDDRD